MTQTTNFRAVIQQILDRITAGPWGPGSLLPSETELATEFGCSRATMNRALREVSDMGLIERKRKSGTRVRMAPLRAARFEMPIVRAEIEKTGASYRYALLQSDIIPAPDWLRAKMDLACDAPVLHLICLHYANGDAFQLEDRWINLTALPMAETHDFSRIGPNEWLIATVPYSQVEVSFCAKAADDLCANYLNHNPGAPVFCVERATWWQSAAITLVTLSHAAGYRMTTHY
jgi:GntR family transcriptional regulator, histidine utilization repressor